MKLAFNSGFFVSAYACIWNDYHFDNFDFSSDFYALDFLRFAWSKIPSQSQFRAADFNWRQFNAKNQMKIAPKLVPVFTLNLNCGIC